MVTELYVKCKHCSIEIPTGFAFSSGAGGQFTNIGVICPNCRRTVQIKDGHYRERMGKIELAQMGINILRESDLSEREVKQIIKILRDGEANHKSVDEISTIIASELPQIKNFTDFLIKYRMEFLMIIGLILAALQIIVPHLTSKNFSEVDTQKIINEVQQSRPVENTKKGVNQLCHCGSGRKSKKCCGAASR